MTGDRPAAAPPCCCAAAKRRTLAPLTGAVAACPATSGTPGGGSMQGLPSSRLPSAMRSTGCLECWCGPFLVGGRRAVGSSNGGCENLQLPSGGLPPRLHPPWKQYSLQQSFRQSMDSVAGRQVLQALQLQLHTYCSASARPANAHPALHPGTNTPLPTGHRPTHLQGLSVWLQV